MSVVWGVLILIAFSGGMIRWALPRASNPELWESMSDHERTLSWLMMWALFGVPTVIFYLVIHGTAEMLETVLS